MCWTSLIFPKGRVFILVVIELVPHPTCENFRVGRTLEPHSLVAWCLVPQALSRPIRKGWRPSAVSTTAGRPLAALLRGTLSGLVLPMLKHQAPRLKLLGYEAVRLLALSVRFRCCPRRTVHFKNLHVSVENVSPVCLMMIRICSCLFINIVENVTGHVRSETSNGCEK